MGCRRTQNLGTDGFIATGGIGTHMARGKLDTNTLVKLILVLVVIWLALEVVGEIIGLLFIGPLSNILGLIVIVVIILWLLDYI